MTQAEQAAQYAVCRHAARRIVKALEGVITAHHHNGSPEDAAVVIAKAKKKAHEELTSAFAQLTGVTTP